MPGFFFPNKVVAFDFDKKLTQSVAQITMWYQVSENFPRLHFAFDQFQDMIWNTEECRVSKNIKNKQNQKYGGKNSDFDFVPILFTLLTFSCLCCSLL